MGQAAEAGDPGGTLGVRAAELQFRGLSVTVSGAGAQSGEEAVFFRPMVSAPAVVRRDSMVLADGWAAALAMLGELEAHLGDGVIEDAVEAVADDLMRSRQRLMSHPFTIRSVIAMGLMPDASYCQALSRLAGLLADVPLARQWRVPTERS